jgi:hypothetical protein
MDDIAKSLQDKLTAARKHLGAISDDELGAEIQNAPADTLYLTLALAERRRRDHQQAETTRE